MFERPPQTDRSDAEPQWTRHRTESIVWNRYPTAIDPSEEKDAGVSIMINDNNLDANARDIRLQMNEQNVNNLSRQTLPFVCFIANTIDDHCQQLKTLREINDDCPSMQYVDLLYCIEQVSARFARSPCVALLTLCYLFLSEPEINHRPPALMPTELKEEEITSIERSSLLLFTLP